jgi:hypothetical protein
MRPQLMLLGIIALAATGITEAHAPATAIGRAVLAFEQVTVSYDPGSVVSDIEAGGFPLIVGSNPKVAFMPSSEIAGGPDAVAAEIAREAGLDGTLVVLVGTELGAWSDDIGADRLAELIAAARTDKSGSSPAVVVESLIRRVQAEPVDSGTPWGWIGAVFLGFAAVSLVAFDRLTKRSRTEAPRPRRGRL